MITTREYCFTHPAGEDIFLFRLCNNKGTEVLISNYGAIINSFKIKQADGSVNDIVLGFDRMEDYLDEVYLNNYPWMGCAIGRTANRIKHGKVTIDGREYQLTVNKGLDHLHGGASGFDKKIWRQLPEANDQGSVLFTCTSPDGDEGYPGNLEVQLKFHLNDQDELSYEFHAVADKPTIVNLTHHSYFNLNNGRGTIADHQIRIPASQILAQDEGLVTNGQQIPIGNTVYDFNEFKPIGKKRDDEEIYDQSYVVDNKSRELQLVAEALSTLSNTKLSVYSTEPVVHFYSGKWFPEVKGKVGTHYGPASGFCLETHIHPNAINIPHFPNTILRPGEKYFHKTVYSVGSMNVEQ